MEEDLVPLKMALRELSEAELNALIAATNNVNQIAPGLLAWIEHVADWELHRRAQSNFALNGPLAAIPPEEEAVSVDALLSLRSAFSQASSKVATLFDTALTLLCRNQRLQ
jgi:hypothetical protein